MPPHHRLDGEDHPQDPARHPDQVDASSPQLDDNHAGLRQSEERLRAFFDASFEALFLSENGICIDQNQSAEAMFGYTLEEALGNPGTDWIAPEHHDLVMKNMIEGVETPYEVTALRKDGTTFPCEIQGRMLEYKGRMVRVTALRDVTAIKKALEEQWASEQENRALIEANPDLMLMVSKEGVFKDFRAAPDTRVYSQPEIFLNRTLHDVMPPEVADLGMKTIERVIATGRTDKIMYTLKVEGLDRYYEARVALCAEETVLFIVRDITETVQLREAESRSERLETAGRVAGQVAHDFNNLLGPLMAYPDMLRDSLTLDAESRELLDSMEDAAKQMSDINQQLLTLGRRGHYTQEPLDLNEIVMAAIRNIAPLSETIVVNTDLADGLMPIKGGATQISRAVTNLLNNAIDALEGDGSIHVATTNHYVDDATMAYDRISRGEYAMLTIRDTGTGIPQDILDRIFDPFFTTKTVTKRRGSGLGLSIVDGVVRDHGGSVDLDSSPGEGTTFRLYFPITRDAVKTTRTISVTGRGETILVVDDDAVQRDVSVRILDKLGYDVTAVESGEHAIRFLESYPRDLLILDMVMPGGIDGAETYRRIVGSHPDQRAIIVSGYSESERVLETQRLGAGSFVKKPLTLDSLGKAVREELDRVKSVKTD